MWPENQQPFKQYPLNHNLVDTLINDYVNLLIIIIILKRFFSLGY